MSFSFKQKRFLITEVTGFEKQHQKLRLLVFLKETAFNSNLWRQNQEDISKVLITLQPLASEVQTACLTACDTKVKFYLGYMGLRNAILNIMKMKSHATGSQ